MLQHLPPHERRSERCAAEVWADELLHERLAGFDSAERMERMQRLIDATREFSLQGLRLLYPQADEHKLRLREAARRLGRDTMILAYGWDPDVERS